MQVRDLVSDRAFGNLSGLRNRSRSDSDLSKRSSQDHPSGQGSGALEIDPEQVPPLPGGT